MAYRKFYFVNSLDERYELTDKNYKTFLNNPSNLGFSKKISTTRFTYSELINSSNYDMPGPTGEMIFYGDGTQYQDYFDFVQFISYTPLRLCYIPGNVIEPYYIDCDVVKLDKKDIDPKDGALHCPITIYGTSLWKTSKQNEVVLTNSLIGEGKFYPLVQPYSYSGYTLSDIEFINNGTLPCSFIFEINGYVQNPQLSAYDTSDNRYGVIKLNGNFDYVRVNTDDNDQEIFLQNGEQILPNPTSYQDLSIGDEKSLMTFFNLRVGKSKLIFTCGNLDSFDGDIRIKWNNEFISV